MALNFAKAEFVRSAGRREDFIRDGLPQFAFAGRSNVGKSSVINRLVGRKNLAYVGASPGKTTQVNYFLIDRRAYLVDLPGYGYAKVSKELAAKWMKMIETYLDTSEALRVVFLLIDIRHEPSKKDVEMYRLLYEKGFNPLIIATKADKISKGAKDKQIALIRKTLGADKETPILPFSALNRDGKEEIWEYIDYFVNEITIE